jgi:cytoplasmic iron level regulating protein YaaA (DUF328/UPF0246 family)
MLIIVLSPSKKQNPISLASTLSHSKPIRLADTHKIIAYLKQLSIPELQKMMSLSSNLAEKTFEQIQVFSTSKHFKRMYPALSLYHGDSFLKLNAAELTPKDLDWAQARLRVLSGLYGALRPLDAIQPYRLDITTRLDIQRSGNLVDFWKKKVSEDLNQLAPDHIINLASIEYSKLLDEHYLEAPIVNIAFRTLKNGVPQNIGLYAKQARGAMARYLIQNQIDTLEQLRQIKLGEYLYAPELSSELEIFFIQ